MPKRKISSSEAKDKAKKIIKDAGHNAIICFSDGSVPESNPGYGGCACVIELPSLDGERIEENKNTYEDLKPLGWVTSPVAELMGIDLVLDLIASIEKDESKFLSSSESNSMLSDESKSMLSDESKSTLSGESKSMLSDESKSTLSGESKSMLSGESKSTLSDESKSILSGESKSISDESKSTLSGESKSTATPINDCTLLTTGNEVKTSSANEIKNKIISNEKDKNGACKNIRGLDIHVLTDSKYCHGLFELNWRASANTELVGKIRKKIAARKKTNKFIIHHVYGHCGIDGNERADVLANKAAKKSAKMAKSPSS